MNLAKWKYAAAMKERGGPIDRITQKKIDFFGTTAFETYAYLDLEKTRFPNSENLIYGSAHGSGTALKMKDSIHRAISEALERWAWHETRNASFQAGKKKQLGFEVNGSTDGFAAYPGFFPGSARKYALFEAAERWAISHWWEEKLTHFLPTEIEFGIKILQIALAISDCCVTILWKDFDQFRAYGFAAAKSLELAKEKSLVELSRNIRVLSDCRLGKIDSSKLSSINEARLAFFASKEGAARFDQRVQKKLVAPEPLEMRLIVDSPVVGEWTRYTHVWRCLYDASCLDSSRNNQNILDYFCF